MVIVLVENDELEIDIAKEEIHGYMPGAEVIEVRNVSDFLLRADELRRAGVVVTERYLPLLELGSSEEETDARVAEIARRFPEIADSRWEGRDGGWVLARWIRRNGFEMPILFHMHSAEEDIPTDIRSGAKVSYCQKYLTPRKLAHAIRDAVTPGWRSWIDRHMTP